MRNLVETNSADVWGQYTYKGANLGDNGPPSEREGGVSGNQYC